jgi:hypothetical protein
MFSKEAILYLIIETLSGGILAFLLVMLVDYLKKPIILFEKGSEAIGDKKHWKFIHIRVGNYKRRFKYIPINTQVAFSARVVISITDGEDTKMFIGRWTSKAQPIGDVGNIINTALVHPREDIHPSDKKDEAVEIAIGLKYENENEFYGFNNESYLHTDFKRQDLKFGTGQFNGEIALSTLGYKYSKKFQINNSSKKREDFWLKVL